MIGLFLSSIRSKISSLSSRSLNSSCLHSNKRACKNPNRRYNMKFSSLSRKAARRGYPSGHSETEFVSSNFDMHWPESDKYTVPDSRFLW
jgi:hypothetical protein